MKAKIIIALSGIIGLSLCLILWGIIINKTIECRHARELIVAIRNDDMEELSRLLEKKVSPNGKWFVIEWPDVSNNPPISEAIRNDNFEALKLLVEAGADVNVKGAKGMTPLHYAVVGVDSYDMAYYLVAQGADINAKDASGATPLEEMILMGSAYRENVYREDRLAMALYLIENGTELFHSRSYGNLMYQAANSNDDRLLSYLWENYEMDVDQRSRGARQTALMFAVMRDAKRSCQFLLDHGADRSIVDKDGKTAYDIALELGHNEIAEMVKP